MWLLWLPGHPYVLGLDALKQFLYAVTWLKEVQGAAGREGRGTFWKIGYLSWALNSRLLGWGKGVQVEGIAYEKAADLGIESAGKVFWMR